MCDQKYCREEANPTFPRLRIFIVKLQKCFSLFAAVRGAAHGSNFDEEEEEVEVETVVPDDVKEGHFAVLAVKGLEKKRFIITLKHLTSLTFLSVLEQAEEEYGFEQTGALVFPCRPEELRKILAAHFDGYQSQF